MKEKIMLVILILVIIASSVTLGYVAQDDISSILTKIRTSGMSIEGDCENLTMRETAYCLNDYVKSIYKYEVRKDSERPTLEELIEDGGDCLNWAELYMGHIEELGFDSKMPMIDTGEDARHTFAVISDESGYCVLDQRNINCQMLGDV